MFITLLLSFQLNLTNGISYWILKHRRRISISSSLLIVSTEDN